jgi:acetoin utilization deacetylase AcuC-like enzyme
MAPALLVDDARFDRHTPLGHHPERPERLVAARAAVRELEASGTSFVPVQTRPASDEELARVHDPGFVERLSKLAGTSGYIDPDTYVSPESVLVARLAAGSLVAAVDALLDAGGDPHAPGRISKAVALLRPPGHHARPARSMGFCLLNNVAVAAAHARARGLERVAVVDWDVHHGNGTQEIFSADPHVLYVSTHQHPFYPGTGDADEVGEGEGAGYSVNVPLAAGSGDAVYRRAFERIVLPVLEAYAPDLVLVSAGFDASAADPLAQMELSAGAFGWMAAELARVADRSAEGRMALVLEGGYDLVALESGLRSALEGMLSARPPPFLVEAPGSRARASGAPGVDDPRAERVDRAARWAKRAWSTVG